MQFVVQHIVYNKLHVMSLQSLYSNVLKIYNL